MAVDAFTVAIIVSVAFALAAFTWRVQGYAGTEPATAPAASGLAGGSNVQQVLALAPFGVAVGESPIMGGTDELTLKAVFAAVPTNASVALIADASGQVTPFSIGDATPGGIVEAIENERVLLRSNSGLRSLTFLPETAAARSPAQPRPAPAARSPAALPDAPQPATASATVPPAAQPVPASPPATNSPPQPTGRATGVDAIRSLIPRDYRGGNPQ